MRSSAEAKNIWFDEPSLWGDLSDGRTLVVRLAWFPRLVDATAEQRTQVEIRSHGLHGEAPDEYLSIAGLLAGVGHQTDGRTSFIA